jgi:transitional endoplasmic reticulum ATPase
MIKLTVQNAYPQDVGHGAARIDYDTMKALGISSGDTIAFGATRGTVAKSLPLNPSDSGKGIIRIDEVKRNNSGIRIGDCIHVVKIQTVLAWRIEVAPLDVGPLIDEIYLAKALESVPLIEGDHVLVPYFGRNRLLYVLETIPNSDPVIVTQKTKFQITDKLNINNSASKNDLGSQEE